MPIIHLRQLRRLPCLLLITALWGRLQYLSLSYKEDSSRLHKVTQLAIEEAEIGSLAKYLHSLLLTSKLYCLSAQPARTSLSNVNTAERMMEIKSDQNSTDNKLKLI